MYLNQTKISEPQKTEQQKFGGQQSHQKERMKCVTVDCQTLAWPEWDSQQVHKTTPI